MYALLCQDIVIYDSALQIGIELLPSAGENDFFFLFQSCSIFYFLLCAHYLHILLFFLISMGKRKNELASAVFVERI